MRASVEWKLHSKLWAVQDFPCLIQLLRTGLFEWFTSYTCNIFFPTQGWMYLFKFMLRTSSMISPLHIRYISFTLITCIFLWEEVGLQSKEQERTAMEHGMSLAVLLDLRTCRLRARECNQQSQQLEFNCPSRNWKQMNRLTEIYLPLISLWINTMLFTVVYNNIESRFAWDNFYATAHDNSAITFFSVMQKHLL